MFTFIQVLLGVVITTLTFFVAVAGIQVFHILHELRLSLKKLNDILAHTHSLSESAARPVTAVNDFFAEVKTLVNNTQDEIIESLPDRVVTEAPHKSPRFFHRSGSPLRPS